MRAAVKGVFGNKAVWRKQELFFAGEYFRIAGGNHLYFAGGLLHLEGGNSSTLNILPF